MKKKKVLILNVITLYYGGINKLQILLPFAPVVVTSVENAV